jgi:hypothetical protein
MLEKYEAIPKYERNNISAADFRIEWAICTTISNHNNEQCNYKLLSKWTSKASKTINCP